MLQYNQVLQRNRLSLDGQWQFWTDPSGSFDHTMLVGTNAISVAVPSPWQAQSPALRNYCGVAWYQRTFTVTVDNALLRTYLGFNAVDYSCEVWVNGVRVGEHEGGYLPFEFDITESIRPGENLLTVRVSDPTDEFLEVPHGKQSWYGLLSGIWQSVWIETRPAKHIQNIRVTPKQEEVLVDVTLNQPLQPGECLVYEIYTPAGELQTQVSAPVTGVTLSVPNPQLWDLDTPSLYSIQVSVCGLHDNTMVIDRLKDTFGFRTIATENGKLMLNGRPIYLRGALDQDYYPDLICTTPSMEFILDEFRKAKELGLNCLRVHIKVADPRYYQAADELGLLIWSELPNCGYLSPEAVRRLRETTEGMIRRDWNHPSLIIWTIINESWGTELHTNPDHRQWLAEMYEWVKTLDPTRLIVDNSPCFPNFHVRSDLDDFHFYAAIPDHHEKWDKWVSAFANRAMWIYGQDKNLDALPKAEKPASIPVLSEKQGNPPPLIVSEFGNWGLPDIKPLFDYYNGEPWWFETGWDWGNGIVYPHRALQRFYDLNLDKVFGDYAGLARASQWSQFDAMKYEIESMRKHDSIQGYVITEFTDLHWEANGLLDILRNPKVYYHRLAEINVDTVILPEVEKHTFWSGETTTIKVSISHYGKEALTGARLEWFIREEGNDRYITEGTMTGIHAEPSTLTSIQPLEVDLPVVQTPTRYTMRFVIRSAWGDQIAQNEFYFSVFPQKTVESSPITCLDYNLAGQLRSAGLADLRSAIQTGIPLVTARLDAELLRFVQQGGKVLFFAEDPAHLETEVPGLELKLRKHSPWDGDWVGNFTWLRHDLFAASIPGDGHFDMTFSRIVPETVIASTRIREFDHSVLAGMFVGWLRKPVGIVQRYRLGRGELVVSTLKLRDQLGIDPVATILTRELVHKLGG